MPSRGLGKLGKHHDAVLEARKRRSKEDVDSDSGQQQSSRAQRASKKAREEDIHLERTPLRVLGAYQGGSLNGAVFRVTTNHTNGLPAIELVSLRISPREGFTRDDLRQPFAGNANIQRKSALFNEFVIKECPTLNFEDLSMERREALCYQFLEELGIPVQQPAAFSAPTTLFFRLQLVGGRITQVPAAALKEGVCQHMDLPDQLPDAAVAAALGHDPRIMYVQIPLCHRQAWGADHPEKELPDISISLSARPKQQTHDMADLDNKLCHRNDYVYSLKLPTESDVVNKGSKNLSSHCYLTSPSGSGYRHLSKEEFRARQTHHRRLVEESFAVSVLQEVVHRKWVLAESDAPIRDWLDDSIEDVGLPVWIPKVECVGGFWSLKLADKEFSQAIGVASYEDGIKAGRLMVEVMTKLQQEMGPDRLLSAKGRMDAYRAFLLEKITQDLEEDEQLGLPFDRFHTGHQVLREHDTYLKPTAAGYYCAATPDNMHPISTAFGEEEVWWKSCVYHHANRLLSLTQFQVSFKGRSAERWVNSMIDYDKKRGIEATPTDVIEKASTLERSIFASTPASHWDFAALKELFCKADSGKNEAKLVNELKSLVPGLSEEALSAKPTSMSPPLVIPIMAIISGRSESIDLFRQLDDADQGTGKPMGHTVDTCIVVPRYIQIKKRTRMLVDVALDFTAVAINSTPGIPRQALLDQIEQILGALQPLRPYYEQAHRGTVVLPNELKALSREVNKVVHSDYSPGDLPALKAAVRRNSGPPTPSAAAMLSRYSGVAGHLREVEKCLLIDEMQGSRHPVSTMLEALNDSVCNMPDSRKKKLVKTIERFAKLAEDRFSVDLASRARNSDGLPTLFWPSTTSTLDLFRLCIKAWSRGISECDVPSYLRTGELVLWEENDWVRLYFVWIVHWAKYRDRDVVTGLRLTFSDTLFSPTEPTLMAHQTHHRPFFTNRSFGKIALDDTEAYLTESVNCLVQAHNTNRLVGSTRPEVLLQEIEWNRKLPRILLGRLRQAGLFAISDAVFDAIEKRPHIVSDNVLAAIRSNGMSSLEHLGTRLAQ